MKSTKPISIPFEFPKSTDGQFIALLSDADILKSRRSQLGLTQQKVADLAHIKLSQYQRLESDDRYLSGSSMRIGLSVCATLLLDPFEILDVNVEQPDPDTMHPQEVIDNPVQNDIFMLKRAGRKPIRKEIMTIYVNYKEFSLLIPYDVINKLNNPKYIQIGWNIPDRRIILFPSSPDDDDSIDVPEQKFEFSILALPKFLTDDNPIAAMNWENKTYALESRLVKDKDANIAILIDLKTAAPTDGKGLNGIFLVPDCLKDHIEDDDWDDDETEDVLSE